MKVLINQEKIPNYRVPFFNMLKCIKDVEEVVITTSTELLGDRDLQFTEQRLPSLRLGPFRIMRKLHRLVKGVDVVILMFDIKWIHVLLFPIIWPRKKIILWGHGFGRSRKSSFANLVRQILANFANGIIFYDLKSKTAFCSGFIGERLLSKSFVAPNTLINELSGPAMKGLKKDSFIFVGRLVASKRLSQLLASFSSNRLNKELRLIIVGDGPELPTIIKESKRLGIYDRIEFYEGTYDNSKLKKLFDRSFAYVATCPTGLGFVHSFSFGCPVLTYKSELHGPEINYCNDENSLFFHSDSTLIDAMCRISTSEHLYESLSEGAHGTYSTAADPMEMLKGFRMAIDSVLQ